MFSEEELFSDDRWVSCRFCGWGGDMLLHLIGHGLNETAEWDCPTCNRSNDYESDYRWHRADEWFDQMREERMV